MKTSTQSTICFPHLDHYQVISFDIFDTAVFRMVFEPRDVFLLMEEELVKKYGSVFLGFSELRFKAELETVSKVWRVDRSLEVKLDEIYNTLFLFDPRLKPFNPDIKTTELYFEESVIIPSYPVLDYFNQARQLQKTILFISDTYLPEIHIAKILKQAGYQGYDRLFISCEVGTNKASGKLFDRVLHELNLAPQDILHMGDNPYSDIKQAARKGFHTYQLPRPADYLNASRYNREKYKKYCFRATASESLFRGIQKNYLINRGKNGHVQSPLSYDIGYQVLGPLCYGFIRWIIQHSEEKNIKHLYFIAREGWFLKKVFDEIKSITKTDIESHYFYGSRRALFFPLLSENVSEYLLSFIMSKKTVKLRKYLDLLGLEVSLESLKKFGFNSKDDLIHPYSNPRHKQRLKNLFDSESEQLKRLAQTEKANYLEYLQQVEMLSNNPIGLVDSGWFGNGQRKLQQLIEPLNPDVNLFGFYLALYNPQKKGKNNFNETSKGYGYLYHFNHFNDNIEAFLEISRIIEVLLSAPAESLKNFSKKNGKIYPVFMKENPNPELHPTITEIHAGALHFVRDFANSPRDQIPILPNYLAANLLEQFIKNPTIEEALTIGSLPYDANILTADHEPRFAFPQIQLIDFLKNPWSLHQEFKKTYWRSAYYHNHSSALLKFVLRYTQRYFLTQDTVFSKFYNLLYRVYKKITVNILVRGLTKGTR